MEPLSTYDVMAAAGVSYRQLDYWTRRGYVTAVVATPGTGVPRYYPAGEAVVAVRMAALTAAGVQCSTAHRVARGEPDALERLVEAVTACIEPPVGREPVAAAAL